MKKNLYLLYGDETFLFRHWMRKLRAGDVEYIVYDGKTISEATLLNLCTTLPFFASEQLYHITNIFDNAAITADNPSLKKALLSPPDGVTIVFSQDGSPDKRKKLFKLLSELCTVQECKPLASHPLQQWMQEYAKELEATLSSDAASLLESSVGSNLWLLSKEIEKLALYAPDKAISEEMVATLTIASAEANVFSFIDMLSEKKTKQALELLHRLVEDQNDVIPLLAMISRQARLLLQALSLQKTVGSRWKDQMSMHPFVLQKLERQVKNFKEPELLALYKKIYSLDKAMKTSGVNAVGAVERLVIEMGMTKP
ncbi:MAG: DNA polymerase III subunit delta [bacterium]